MVTRRNPRGFSEIIRPAQQDNEAFDLGYRFEHAVPRHCVIEDGRIVSERPPAKWYAPLGQPELPAEFAKLADGDTAAIVRFYCTYGRLGGGKPDEPDEPGDPVDWVVSHARAVRLALDLSARRDDERALLELFAPLRRKNGDVEIHVHDIRERYAEPMTIRAVNPRAAALRGIASILGGDRSEGNLFVCRRVTAEAAALFRADVSVPDEYEAPPERPAPTLAECEAADDEEHVLVDGFDFADLLSAIYWKLADAVTGNTVRICAHCSRPFVSTDAREKYCPRSMGNVGVSLCLNRARQKRFREARKADRRAGDREAKGGSR